MFVAVAFIAFNYPEKQSELPPVFIIAFGMLAVVMTGLVLFFPRIMPAAKVSSNDAIPFELCLIWFGHWYFKVNIFATGAFVF